jgi:hypothetical protein
MFLGLGLVVRAEGPAGHRLPRVLLHRPPVDRDAGGDQRVDSATGKVALRRGEIGVDEESRDLFP